jgi:copper transport protein
MWRRATLAAVLAGLWLVTTGPAAGAHAMLRGSDPAAGASLDRAPGRVTLTFTEAPDPALSVVHVLDTSGREVSAGPAAPVAGSQLQLRAGLRALGAGTYTVTWRAVSRVDGHVSRGAFAFGVGLPAMATPSPNAGASVDVLQGPGPLAVAARWAFYWGFALLLGAAATGLLVFERRLPARAGLLLGAALALAGGGLAAMTIAGWSSAAVPLGTFLGSSTGRWLEARGGAVVLAAAAVGGLLLAGSGRAEAARPEPASRADAKAPPPGPAASRAEAKAPPPGPAASRARATGWLVALGAAACGGLLVHALAGHAAAPGPLLLVNLLSQWAHLLSVAVWIGGLAWLLAGIAGRPRAELRRAAARFSLLATWSLVVVALSGLERASQELGGWGHLLSTSFGRTLGVKLGLFALLAVLGAVNRFRVVPALAAGNGRLAWLRRTVRGELVVAGGILLAAALLSQLPPGADASGARPAAPPSPVAVRASGADYTTSVRVILQVSPGSAGPNRFVATLADYDTGRPLVADHVRLSASLPARPDVAAAQLDLTRAADGSWQGRGSVLTIAGTWAITTLVERPDGGVTVPIELRVRAAPPN